MSVDELTTPNNRNSVDVTLKAEDPGHPEILTLYQGDTPIQEVNFPSDKRFIRFTFPDNYTNFDIRVFEISEKASKTKIMTAYREDPSAGLQLFASQWDGQASSGKNRREFKRHPPQSQMMVIRDKDTDGTEAGTLHDYILKFTYNRQTYLLDPSIRNRQVH
ncbi:hypothetical protein [Salinimonas chungwhensis]|uniref:hypothetical protein n=1 Tax=Salinimonas chungwhensis TaxID=265425 RepID=UPI00038156EB|nr:hypothetical protein [Salinimonas chungwhensis]